MPRRRRKIDRQVFERRPSSAGSLPLPDCTLDRFRVGGEGDRRGDRVVVAERRIAKEHLLGDRFAVDRVLEGVADIRLVERRLVGLHHEDVVAKAGRDVDLDVRVLLQQVDGLEVAAVDVVDLAAGQRVGSRGNVGDYRESTVVEVGRAVIVRVLLDSWRGHPARTCRACKGRCGRPTANPSCRRHLPGRLADGSRWSGTGSRRWRQTA